MVFLKWLSRLIIGCVAIVAAWGAWYVIYKDSVAAMSIEQPAKKTAPLSVEFVRARLDSIDDKIVLVGNFLPATQTEVRSLVDGYIRSMPYDVGDQVTVDEVICKIDDTTHRDLLEQARATLEVAEAQLAVQESELKSAQRILDRELMLDERGVGTLEALETAHANREIASSRLKLEKARVAEARSSFTGLEIQLKHYELRSPITGYVSAKLADLGDLAKPDLPLMQIVDLDTVRTTVHIVEKDFQNVAVGQQAIVSVDAYPNRHFVGIVKRIAPVLDEQTRTAPVQIEVNNLDGLLKPGMYARVSLNAEITKQGIMIPLASILEMNGRPFVYLVNQAGTTELRQVEIGPSDGVIVEVVDGIEEGDQVMTLGNRLVQPGQAVVSKEVEWETITLLSTNEEVKSTSPENSEPLAGD